jgi:4-amino-4-deoxy-L-arabinose transferase-like glycosyltransferase
MKIKTHHINILSILIVAVFLVVSYFSLFYNLGKSDMQLWDESSYALNALEMEERGTPFRMYLLGIPELYNTKPPLSIWCMAVSIKVFGFTECAIRLPSAFCAFLAAFLLFLLLKKYTTNYWMALFAPLILLSSNGFINFHEARSGDTDAMLAWWILCYCVGFFLYTQAQHDTHKNRWLLATCIGVTLACFTKGIAGLTALPGLFLWAVYTYSFKSIITNKYFYLGILIFIIIVPGYYVLRNYLTPGYIDTVLHYEFRGRIDRQEFLNPEPLSFYYYYDQFIAESRLYVWIWLLPLAIIAILVSKTSQLRMLGLFFVIALVGVSISLGLSSTKLFWYDAPMYPLIAGVIASGIILISETLATHFKWIVATVFTVFFLIPFQKIIARNASDTQISYFREAIFDIRNNIGFKDTLYVAEVDINFPIYFYLKQDSLNGYIGRVYSPHDSIFKPGVYFATCKYAREVDMSYRFTLDTIYHKKNCAFYRIRNYK